jgi:potassium-transporting ATPase potassium-binding subunit
MISDIAVFILYLAVLIALALPLGRYMARVLEGERTWMDPVLAPIEKGIYRVCGIKPDEEMNWKEYAWAFIVFHVFGLLAIMGLQMGQHLLPLNPQNLNPVPWDLALNTGISFLTNTNWQAYAPEATTSYLTEMAGMTVQNFVSAVSGLAVATALMRGLTRKQTKLLGNYWKDMVRGTLWIMLPLSIVFALLFVQQGVIQNLLPYQTVTTLEGAEQTLAMGPAASQEAIKMLGTNGGGFFNANSAHPFENPTPLTNFLEALAIFLVPTSLVFMFGHLARDKRQGYAILATMLLLFCVMLAILYGAERYGNPNLAALGLNSASSMEGKEVRFGQAGTALFSVVTTAASCGAVNGMFDSFTPFGGMIPMLQIMLGEVIVGGVGAGFYGMMVFVVLTVFIVGLMVGRTPEYLGKKIEAFEMKMATLAILIPATTILVGTAIASVLDVGTSSLNNAGPHGLSEMLYAYVSCTGNNGSAFAGLNANTLFYNLSLSAALLLGRFGVLIPVLAIAGSMAEKKTAPPSAGTFPTHGVLFVVLLATMVIIVGALTFLPALALGPIVEHLLMLQGQQF